METMSLKHLTLADYLGSDRTVRCEKCKEELKESELAAGAFVCPLCGKYNRMPARVRIESLVDEGSFEEMWENVVGGDPIGFPDYPAKCESSREKSGESEGVLCGRAKIGGHRTCLFVMESKFMMGSMGTVVGDRITALFEYATREKLPVVGYTVSGGARMQEGMLSLMQMEKTSAAIRRHNDAGLFYLVSATDPTTGGVTASFAMLGDVIISEPGAQIGFAGKRVVEPGDRAKNCPKTSRARNFSSKTAFSTQSFPAGNSARLSAVCWNFMKGGDKHERRSERNDRI